MAKTTTIYEQAETTYVQRTYDVTVNALAASAAATLDVCTVPAGFVVEYARLDIPAMGANTIIDLGYAGTLDGLVAGADSSSAEDAELTAGAQGTQFDAVTTFVLSNSGSGATTASDLVAKVTIGGWKASGGGNDLDL